MFGDFDADRRLYLVEHIFGEFSQKHKNILADCFPTIIVDSYSYIPLVLMCYPGNIRSIHSNYVDYLFAIEYIAILRSQQTPDLLLVHNLFFESAIPHITDGWL